MKTDKKTLLSVFGGVAGCILLYWVLFETERVMRAYHTVMTVLSPFIVGGVLAFILNVPMRWIENLLGKIKKREIRRPIALLLTLLVVILVFALAVGLLIPQVLETGKSVVDRLPGFVERVESSVVNFLRDNPEMMQWVQENVLAKLDLAGIVTQVADVLSKSISTIISGAFTAIGGVTNSIVNAVISLVFAIYCLFRKEILARQGRRLLYAFLPEKWCDAIVRILRLTNSTFSNFLSGQCLEVCILGCMFAVSMAIFQMPYIPLVSVLVAVTAFIPIVGAFVGCFFGALLILVDNPLQAVWFVAMFLVLQQIENNLIYPRVVGTSIGLPGMWVLLAVAVGGEIMGVAGMFLMIPMTAVLYVVLREVTNARLERRAIGAEKLRDHPPELRSHLRVRLGKRKSKPTNTTQEKTEK